MSINIYLCIYISTYNERYILQLGVATRRKKWASFRPEGVNKSVKI